MAQQIWSNAKLFFGGYDMSGDINAMALKYGAEAKDATNFNSGLFKEFKPGLRDVSFAHEGFFDASVGGVDTTLFADLALTSMPMTICPQAGAEGEVAFTFNAIEGLYAPGAKVGDMLAFSVSGSGDGALVKSTILHNAARTAGANGSVINAGAAAAGQKLYAAMHVLAISGTTKLFNCKVQSAALVGFGSPTDRITFAQQTAIGAQWATPVAGPITDAYWRVVYTLSGVTSVTFAVVIGIQ